MLPFPFRLRPSLREAHEGLNPIGREPPLKRGLRLTGNRSEVWTFPVALRRAVFPVPCIGRRPANSPPQRLSALLVHRRPVSACDHGRPEFRRNGSPLVNQPMVLAPAPCDDEHPAPPLRRPHVARRQADERRPVAEPGRGHFRFGRGTSKPPARSRRQATQV